jgi:CubicO group peptidase (beta-lactamase class C family)
MHRWLLPPLLLSLSLLHAAAAAAAIPERFIAEYAQAHDFSGTLLVRQRGQPDYRRSFGLAQRAFAAPNAADTRYKIASITKLFTAVLVLQAHEQGRLDLDASIGRYLPDYRGPARDRVELRQLLNHTSGLSNFDQVKTAEQALREGLPPYQKPYTSQQLLDRFCSGALVHAPGTVFDYNNGDYVILGKILERAYGRSYEQILRERILDPLGLRDTGVLRSEALVARLADTYYHLEPGGPLRRDPPMYPENWYAAGALYSSADDTLAFAEALFGGRLLRPESLALMLSPGLDHYGYGLWSYTVQSADGAHRIARRPGAIAGAQAQLYRDLDAELTVVILANTDSVDLDEFAAQIGQRATAP